MSAMLEVIRDAMMKASAHATYEQNLAEAAARRRARAGGDRGR
jgi:hypothetical protein